MNKKGKEPTLFALTEQIAIEGLDEPVQQFLTTNSRFFERLRMSRSFSLASDFSDAAVEYIYAHAVTQTVIYSAKDINDYFVRTIHEFANQRVLPGSPIHGFIVKWMQEFKIGSDYEINSVGGEAHVVKITNNDGTIVNLADKGMGSIQMMILLFRLATKMAQSSVGLGGRLKDSTIIVEEPEQNLHPMLQSKLAELFYSLNQEYGFRFIIETHSEYLIRRTQALVGTSFRENSEFVNPFKVYYFPTDGTPYDMPYAKTGRFEEQFGTGFFDEATKWNREVLRNENRK
jgi:predicted ATPase